MLMKLRNKKTGKVGDLLGSYGAVPFIGIAVDYHNGNPIKYEYDSIAKLNEEWEDYKPIEPKTNSRFRLKKDLPTFKAGQEFHLSPKGNLILDDGKGGICAYIKNTLKKFPNILEDWFEPIDNEDINVTNIEPKEPLIKDEKVRKAVRAWAEANKTITTVHVMGNGYELYGGNTDSVIYFETLPFDHIKPDKYTIDELCGEEEE